MIFKMVGVFLENVILLFDLKLYTMKSIHWMLRKILTYIVWERRVSFFKLGGATQEVSIWKKKILNYILYIGDNISVLNMVYIGNIFKTLGCPYSRHPKVFDFVQTSNIVYELV